MSLESKISLEATMISYVQTLNTLAIIALQ